MQSCISDPPSLRMRIRAILRDPKIVRVAFTLILGALGSIPLVILTPPFQVPDEMQHFYRAYQLSGLQLRAEIQDGRSGGTLPVALQMLVRSTGLIPEAQYHAAIPEPLSDTVKLASTRLNESDREFVPFSGSAFYSPLPYIPQIISIALGRLCGLGPLQLLYLARLFNCIFALTLLALSVYMMPIAAELVMLVGLLPMSLYLYASASPDASIISCALLFTSLSFSAIEKRKWQRWELVTAAISAAVFCSVKPPYSPLLFIGVLPHLLQRERFTNVLRSHLVLIFIPLGVAAIWLHFTQSRMTRIVEGASPSLQLAFIRRHPELYFAALLRTLRLGNLLGLYYSGVGIFGWLSVWLQPVFAFFLPLLNLGILWAVGVQPIPDRSILRSIWYASLSLSGAFLVITAMYLMGTQVAQSEVVGVQGRYFIPLAVVAGMAAIHLAPRRRPSASPWTGLIWTGSIVVLQIFAMDSTIIRAFHVFS